jgi:hypothetical protein
VAQAGFTCWPSAQTKPASSRATLGGSLAPALEGARRRRQAQAANNPSPQAIMSELDRIKEQIAYLKYWQGIMVVTDISLVGWLLTAGESASVLIFLLAIAGVIALTLGIVNLHRQIERRIERIGSL